MGWDGVSTGHEAVPFDWSRGGNGKRTELLSVLTPPMQDREIV